MEIFREFSVRFWVALGYMSSIWWTEFTRRQYVLIQWLVDEEGFLSIYFVWYSILRACSRFNSGVVSIVLAGIDYQPVLCFSVFLGYRLLSVEHFHNDGKPSLYLVFEYVDTDLRTFIDMSCRSPDNMLPPLTIKVSVLTNLCLPWMPDCLPLPYCSITAILFQWKCWFLVGRASCINCWKEWRTVIATALCTGN